MRTRARPLLLAFTIVAGCGNDPPPPVLLGFGDEAPGANCAQGGTRIESGRDDDGDGVLDPAEVERTAFACDGRDGEDGQDGSDGADGKDGADGADGADGVDGIDGQDGADGEDGDDGTDGQDGEDGQDGHDVLIALTPEPPGPHCASGGTRVDTGLDLDGDGVLDAAEITATAYLCDGDDGAPGIAGFRLLAKVTGPGGPIAEIVAATPDGRTLAYTSSTAHAVGFANIADPARPVILGAVDVSAAVAHGNGEPTSVAITPDGRHALVTVKDPTDSIARADPGALVFIAVATRTIVATIPLGVGPDSLDLTPDGTRAVIAIEDEEDPDGNAVAQARPGSVQVVTIDAANPGASTVATIPLALPAGVGNHRTDPQPEYVDITPDGATAIVSLQENNLVTVVDLATSTVVRYIDAGTSSHATADLASDRVHGFPATTFVGQLQPDGVCLFAGGTHFLSANEGDTPNQAFGPGLYSGGRGFSIFTVAGARVHDSGDTLQRLALRAGMYPEGRSANRGIEPEGCATGRFGGTEYGFVLAERGSWMAVVDLSAPAAPVVRQLVGAPNRPESAVAIAHRNLLVVGGEGDDVGGGLWIYEAVTDAGDVGHAPGVYDTRSDGTPFAALGALAHDPASGMLLATPDTAFAGQRLWSFWIDHVTHRLQLVGERLLRDAAGAPLTGHDPEGLAVNPEGGVVIASEGTAGNGGSTACVGSSRSNRLLFFDATGRLDPAYGTGGVVDLPCGAAPGAIDWTTVRAQGFEGVAVVDTQPFAAGGLVVYVAFQRPLAGEAGLARIGAYDVGARTWRWYFYPLEADPGGAAGTTSLGDLLHVGGDKLAVIERDDGWAGAAGHKAVRVFRLGSGTADDPADPVDKVLARDLLAGAFRFDQEKVEGLALGAGSLWVTNDNDNGTAANFVVRLDPAVLDVEPPSPPPPPPPVVVNEVASSPVDFVELYNRATTAVELSGWTLTDNDPTHVYTLPAGTTIAAGGRLLVEHDTSTAPLRLTFGLGSADAIILHTPAGVVVDSHAWTAHVASASRCADGVGATFTAPTAATPGAPNTCP